MSGQAGGPGSNCYRRHHVSKYFEGAINIPDTAEYVSGVGLKMHEVRLLQMPRLVN